MKRRGMLAHPGELRSWVAMQTARRVCRALMDHRGNWAAAARELGVVSPYLYQVIRGYYGRML